ncbi:MAG: hypothetical protein ACKOW1_04610 [Novosphingobium sp.]
MDFTLYPLKGVDDIEFGMNSEMVGRLMNGRLTIGNIRAVSADHPTYAYPDVPVFFYFDSDGHLDSIEFCRGSEIDLYGVNLFDFTVPKRLSSCGASILIL